MEVLKCKDLEKAVLEDLHRRVDVLHNSGITPVLTMISVGEDPASKTYVSKKEKVAKELGIVTQQINLPENTSEEELIECVRRYTSTCPTIVQLPLPKHISADRVIESLDPDFDVDGFTAVNIGKLLLDQRCFLPATPKGITKILKNFDIDVGGKHVVVVGRSNIVGRPLSNILSSKSFNATVTLCHSHTPNISEILATADVVVVATGHPGTVKVSDLKNTATVIDVGVNRVVDNSERGWHLEGDFDHEGVESTSIRYTPVPGGVGLMTVAMLMENTVECYERS